jgi:hypothetical protein
LKAEVIQASRHPQWPEVQDLITLRLQIPTIVLAQFNKHTMIASNAGSMRAIPTKRVLRGVLAAPAFPPELGANKPGMTAGETIKHVWWARTLLWVAVYVYCAFAWALSALGGHKQWVNRLVSPFATSMVVATATREWWEWFLALRNNPGADPALREVAKDVAAVLEGAPVTALEFGEWHLPFDSDGDVRRSVARCARTSYSTFDRPDVESPVHEDWKLYNKLVLATPPHMTPTEHQGQAIPVNQDPSGRWGKKMGKGWICYRSVCEGLVEPANVGKVLA